MPVMYLAGKAIDVPDDQVAAALDQGYTPEAAGQHAQRLTADQREADYGGIKGKVVAGTLGVARAASLGGSDVLLDQLGGSEGTTAYREVNPGASLAGELSGSFVGLGAGASRLGARIAATAEGASIGTKLARGAVGYGVDGGLQGLGQGVSELALSDDPLTVERIGSVLGSNVLLGGGIGGGVGILGKGLEVGLTKAKGALDEIAARSAASEVTDDLVRMDRKGLRAAEKSELDAIEAGRVPERKAVSEEIAGFRREMKEQKVWLATKGAEDAELRAIGKRTLKADRQLDGLIDDPKYFAENPKGALSALRKQEAALDELVNKHGEKLRATFAGDESGARLAALENAGKALERNRALQQRIADVTATPSSTRLSAIGDAREALAVPKAQPSIGEKIASGSAYSVGAGLAGSIPVIGPYLAPLGGAAAANFVGERLFGTMTKTAAEQASRTSKAIDAFLTIGGKVAPAIPPLATKVLAAVRYAPPQDGAKSEKAPTLASSYKARAEELRSQTQYMPDGKVAMRPEARVRIGAQLAPVATKSPQLADQLEQLVARRVEFLASKLPRRPDIGMQIGPDHWQPSDFEMRSFARYAAGVEDPSGIEERLAHGTVSPEDAEVMREVYPERLAQLTVEIVGRLPELRKTLPYQRRLALSILTGVAVDPAMDPAVLDMLQSSFTEEPGSEGGMQQPRAQPAFGSVSKPKGTPSQQRAGGTV